MMMMSVLAKTMIEILKDCTNTSGSGPKRGEYLYHDVGCPAIWWLKEALYAAHIMLFYIETFSWVL